MNTPLTMLLLLGLTTFSAPGPSVNGLKIVTRQVTGGFTDTRTEYIAGDKLRNEWHSQMRERTGPPMATIILRNEHDHIYVLDLEAHEYTMFEGSAKGAMVGLKPRPMVDSGGTLQIWIQNIDTGERKDIFGHVARHIITKEKRLAGPGACSKPSETETDGWYIAGSELPEWKQQKGGQGVVVAAEVAAGSNDKCFNKMDKIELHRTGVETGFPVKIMTTLRSQITDRDGTQHVLSSTWGSEVIELQEGPLELSLFEVPKDFKKVEVLRSWNVPPPRPLTGWEWFKDKVQELFR